MASTRLTFFLIAMLELFALPAQGVKHNVIELDKISQNCINYYFYDQAQVVSLGLSFSICKNGSTESDGEEDYI